MTRAGSTDLSSDIQAPVFANLPWVVHGFGTIGSPAPELSLATVRQVHSADIVDADGVAGVRGQGDALISAVAGVAVGVKTADCVPVLLADSNQCVVAAVHAGWRGTVAEIVRFTVERMIKDYGTNPSDIVSAIGPAIGLCCFEVGPEVGREFSKWDASLAGVERKTHVNLAEVNRLQLLAARLKPGNVQCIGLCTMCESETFYSFRRQREKAGRMISWIGIKQDYAEATNGQSGESDRPDNKSWN